VQWSAKANAGFSTASPWFYVNPNYQEVNAASQVDDPDSLWSFYRDLLKFRKSPIVRCGSYKELCKSSKNLYVYEREYQGTKLLVVCSFTDKPVKFRLPEGYEGAEKKFGNHPGIADALRPYEVAVFLKLP